jgi:hypothetical protein
MSFFGKLKSTKGTLKTTNIEKNMILLFPKAKNQIVLYVDLL